MGAAPVPPPELPLEPPLGTYDALPEAALARRALEQQLRELFLRWGYQEVITPTLELDEVVRRAGLALSGRQLYRFVDREGQVLTLRPDWTPAVARLVASRMRRRLAPLRLFYLGSVFRYERPRPDSPREFVQAGVELVGCAGELADAEVIALAVEACRAAGIQDARVEMGHAGYVQALMELLPEPAREAAREALTRRDLVAYEQAVAQAGLEGQAGQALARLPRSRGGPEVVQKALEGCPSAAAARALESLERLWRQLERLGLTRAAAVDLGLVKDLDYYTGVVFEVYAPDAGYSLAAGGRYDTLLARFGVPSPATGFAASVDRLAAVAGRRGRKPRGPSLVWVLACWTGGHAARGAGDVARGAPDPAQGIGGAAPGVLGADQGARGAVRDAADAAQDAAHAASAGADAASAAALDAAWELAAELRRRGVAAAGDLLCRPLAQSLQAAREHGASWAVAPLPYRP